MIGMMTWTPPAGGVRQKSVVLETRALLHLRVAWASVARGPRTPEALVRRRVLTAAKRLRKAGVTRLVVPEAFAYGEQLEKVGVAPVSTLPLRRALAADLARAVMAGRNLSGGSARLAVAGDQLSGELVRTVTELALGNRYVLLDVPYGGDTLANQLRREYGVSLLLSPTRQQMEEADVLVGTQMIVKGHDFPNVTLVGVLAADLSMFSGDYMAGERTFQLLTQAAGRAGRGEKPGLAVIQTYQPEHYAVTCAAAQDYEAFYRQEILYRRLMRYPPAGHMMAVIVEHMDEMMAREGAILLAGVMTDEEIQVLPPADGFRAKEKDYYRKVIYIKSNEINGLIQCRERAQSLIHSDTLFREMNVQFDINPMNLY